MSKHTPGPWSVRREERGSRGDDILVIETTPHGNDICGIYSPEAIDVANAALIAAAPDLLTIALRVIGMAQTHDRAQDDELWELCEAARAAVAKAKGE